MSEVIMLIVVVLIVGALFFVVIIGYAVSIYNRLISRRAKVGESWSGIEVQLKKRHNLIPNLVSTVKGYTTHEQDTLEKVINARNKAASAGNEGAAKSSMAEGFLTGALKQLFALSESYPDLKASVNFIELQKELSELETSIEKARRYYNGTVRDLKITIESFPSNLVANYFDFETADFFELDEANSEEVSKTPKVEF